MKNATELPISVREIHYAIEDKQILQQLSLEISSGKIVGLLGRNGSGKTTLIECMLGLREIDRGTLSLFGESPALLSDTVRARLGYVPQQLDLYSWLTARQMLDFFRVFFPAWNSAKVDGLLKRWSIPEHSLIATLSPGQKQRLSIIRALAHDPDLLILDEPVSSLDPAGRREFLRELVTLSADRQTTVFFSTHILSDIERIATDITILSQGRIALNMSTGTVSSAISRIVGPAAVLAGYRFERELYRQVLDTGGTTVVLAVTNGDPQITLQSQPDTLVENVSLEDAFIEMTA